MSELDALISQLEALGDKTFPDKVAKRAESTLGDALRGTLEAGTSPDGEPWAEREKGGRAYANAARKLTVGSYGNLVRTTVTGPEVYGHFGAHGMPERKMLPDAGGGIPDVVDKALTEAARQAISEALK